MWKPKKYRMSLNHREITKITDDTFLRFPHFFFSTIKYFWFIPGEKNDHTNLHFLKKKNANPENHE